MADSSDHLFDSSAFMNIFNSPEHDIWNNNGFLLSSNGNQLNSPSSHPQSNHKSLSSSQKQVKGNIFNPQPSPQHRHSVNTISGLSSSMNSIFNPTTSISAPSSSAQRRSTSHLHNNTSLLESSSLNPNSNPTTSTTTTTSTTVSTSASMATSSVTNKPANLHIQTLQSSPTVWPNYSNTSLEDISNLNPNTSGRSSRFFPSPFETNRTFDMDLNNTSILNGSPLVDNRRSTLPNFESSSPFHNNSTNTPTPQFDSPNANYFNYLPTAHSKSVTYSSVFNDSNTSTISHQYSNFTSTPIQSSKNRPLVDRNLSYPNIDYSFVNMNAMSINNQPNLQLNPLHGSNDYNDYNDMTDDMIYQMDGFKNQRSSIDDNSNDNILPSSNFSDTSFTAPKPITDTSPIHSPSPSSSFLPQLNLKGVYQSSPIKEKTIPEPSPHTPLNQQDLIKLLQLNTINTPKVKSADIDSPVSPTSSNFPSPTLPSAELIYSSQQDIPIIETKSRISHFINNMITRHDIVYRSFIALSSRNIQLRKSINLLENLIYPFGTIKVIERLTPDNEDYLKLRVIAIIAESQLTTINYTPTKEEPDSDIIDKEIDDKKDDKPWKTIDFNIDNEEAKILVFKESENTDYSKLNRSDVMEILLNREDLTPIIENSINSMSKSLTLNNKLDVCWYPEGFSSTFHRRGVNNFMFVRELQSKMIVNRTRVSGGGIVEMGEFRISMPIEEMGFTNDKLNGEKLKRSFLVNIDLKELDGKSDHDTKKDKHDSKEHSSSPSSNRGKFKKRGTYSRGRGRGGSNSRN
ncbi:hypothetical protein CANINC_004189 [Pichia inconspicua]|uniref:Uncharacterized protein n=1 Tax=Pichia inconspicua TaxID=52247 RepID=A0A4T0WWT4_9ASCO|nr:hypothetical protein CANINC_004189 [[Candida] inconspicua]